MSNPRTLLLETLKIEEGEVHNLSYHQARCDRSREALFASKTPLDLSSLIQAPAQGLWRCRILYHSTLYSIEYIPYHPREIESLQIIEATLSYAHKYANREELNRLVSSCEADDILLSHNGYVQETSIANIAFYDGEKWYTPSRPLLQGTMRAKLLDEGFLEEKEIKISEIMDYNNVALMNAMIGFKIIDNLKIKHERQQ